MSTNCANIQAHSNKLSLNSEEEKLAEMVESQK